MVRASSDAISVVCRKGAVRFATGLAATRSQTGTWLTNSRG